MNTPITTLEEYEKALTTLTGLLDAQLGTIAEADLEALTEAVIEYELQHFPIVKEGEE